MNRKACIVREEFEAYPGFIQKVRYYDKNGVEIHAEDEIKNDSGRIEKVVLTEDGYLGTDATNPDWIKSGRAVPCEYGVYTLVESELQYIQVMK